VGAGIGYLWMQVALRAWRVDGVMGVRCDAMAAAGKLYAFDRARSRSALSSVLDPSILPYSTCYVVLKDGQGRARSVSEVRLQWCAHACDASTRTR
jgi:hypothetical protein